MTLRSTNDIVGVPLPGNGYERVLQEGNKTKKKNTQGMKISKGTDFYCYLISYPLAELPYTLS